MNLNLEQCDLDFEYLPANRALFVLLQIYWWRIYYYLCNIFVLPRIMSRTSP